jgi:hypothetical protein
MTLKNLNMKKQIKDNWLVQFPNLYSYTNSKLYLIIGPIVSGIELIKLPRTDEYRPYFVCYPLWKNNVKECLNEPYILQEILNKKGLQFHIPYNENEKLFLTAVDCFNDQIQIDLGRDIYLVDFLNLISSQFSYTLVKASPVQQAKIFEIKLFVTLFINNAKMVNKILDEIKAVGKNWKPSMFDWKYLSFEKWIDGLMVYIDNRESFLNQILLNKQQPKLSKLHELSLLLN